MDKQIKKKLKNIDLNSVRAIRAVLCGTETPTDTEKLKDYEAETKRLRECLKKP